MKALWLALLVCTACSQTPSGLSESFHGLPEDGAALGSDDLSKDESKVGAVTEDFVETTSNALEATDRPVAAQATGTGDRVPWHMEYLLTDLSVSASGLLGALVMKGTPAVTFIWRKQHSVRPSVQDNVRETVDLSVTNATSEDDMAMQLEPAIRMAAASGRVKNKEKLRASLLSAARDFQAMGGSIGENPGHEWWVSRLRLDLTLDAAGTVTPVVGVGGEIRFRFEWHHVMKSAPVVAKMAFGVPSSKMRDFISATAEDLSALSDETPKPEGFKAYCYRVGIGISASGDIGIAKSTASLMGQVYFSRDVAKPKVHAFSAELLPDTINVIESTQSPRAESHALYATANGISFTRATDTRGDEIVYKVDRKKIRKGLMRAAKMGLIFGRHAGQSKGRWKVYELRTGLDLSITGKAGLTQLSGLATSEIDFYNQSF